MIEFKKVFSIEDTVDENRIWDAISVKMQKTTRNVHSICHYGVTEVLNNAIDHSEGKSISIGFQQSDDMILMEIEDDGVGVFNKLQNHFNLDSESHALIELVKGKLTVAPESHSGEGLFFSSKMFEKFTIESGSISVTFEESACEIHWIPFRAGTKVTMSISPTSPQTPEAIFARYTDPEEYTFCKTKFFVSLAAFEDELISRSQAKRVFARFDEFQEIDLDFSGVSFVGQGFADELIRVWPLKHPTSQMVLSNIDDNLMPMLKRVVTRSDLPQPSRPIIMISKNQAIANTEELGEESDRSNDFDMTM